VICRCENVCAGTLREAAGDGRAIEINRLKALTRVGMGRCQGRLCAGPAAELLACGTGRSIDDVARLRAQPPIKPISLTARPPGPLPVSLPDSPRDPPSDLPPGQERR